MFAADTTITFPSWVERIALPEYPPMPVLGYVLLGLGALLLLIGYFAPIKKFLALLTSLILLAYYPFVYLFYWYLFRFDEQGRLSREPTKSEAFLLDHKTACAWSILGVCAFFGLLFFVWTVWATLRKRRSRVRETASVDNPFAEQAPLPPVSRPQPAVARPAAPRPAVSPPGPQVRKVPKKPPTPPSSDSPFNFG